MIQARRLGRTGLTESYCSQLILQLERRRRDYAALRAKEEAERAARLAAEAFAANQARLAAQAADRAKSNFLATMSHELRTPLNAIIGFSEVIYRDDLLPRERYPEYAKHIHEAGIHLLDIVNEILDLARIDAGRVELDEELLPIIDVMHASMETILPLAIDKSLTLNCQSELRDRLVYVDPTKMRQVLINLLGNAVKFTEEGGRVSLTAFLGGGDELVISVMDTGTGIPSEDIDRVLRPFEQAENPFSLRNKGTGLGLSIARALVKLHGGELMLESEFGRGTTVSIHLPGHRVREINVAARQAARMEP